LISDRDKAGRANARPGRRFRRRINGGTRAQVANANPMIVVHGTRMNRRVFTSRCSGRNVMSAAPFDMQNLEPFAIGVYLHSYAREDVIAPDGPPTPLLDPEMVQAAMQAYDDAAGVLRARGRSALRPGTRHALANKILRFAIFGERDRRLLSDRALAHFL
jgi:hypothetical protein